MSLALSIRQLSKTYANGLSALKGIDLDVEEGDFFALLGPNGAGKSTTIGIICSLVRKSGGSISVFGTDIDRDFPRAKRHIGVVPQEFNFNNFEKVGDILATQAGYYGLPLALARERAVKYLHRLELWDKRASPARTLSGGMKRRLMIARALVHEPRLLILDEPTAGVDIELRRSMWAFLRELNASGTTIILTTHYLEEAESLCRNIAIIDGGRIIENTGVKQLLRQMQVETFVLDLGADVGEGFVMQDYPTRVLDARTLEVTVQKGQSLNAVFAALSSAGLPVVSMRNKANRLEELFVGLLHKNKAEAAA